MRQKQEDQLGGVVLFYLFRWRLRAELVSLARRPHVEWPVLPAPTFSTSVFGPSVAHVASASTIGPRTRSAASTLLGLHADPVKEQSFFLHLVGRRCCCCAAATFIWAEFVWVVGAPTKSSLWRGILPADFGKMPLQM